MATELHQELHDIVDRKSRATELDTLIQGYRLCARSEGKSPNTITLATAAVDSLRRFLLGKGAPHRRHPHRRLGAEALYTAPPGGEGL